MLAKRDFFSKTPNPEICHRIKLLAGLLVGFLFFSHKDANLRNFLPEELVALMNVVPTKQA